MIRTPSKQRQFLSRAGRLSLVAASLLGSSCSPSVERDGPDVLLISLDSVRGDFLTFEDAETAPHLTELAARGTIFTQAVAGTSWTLPTHVQMFTGLPPALHGVQEDDLRLDPLVPTLPRILDEHEYDCAGFWTCWYLAGEYGFEDGFALYQNSMQEGEELQRAFEEAMSVEGSLEERRKAMRESKPADRTVNSRLVVRNASRVIEECDPERKLFLFTHFYDPHFDYIPPPPWHAKFDPDYAGTINGSGYWTNQRVYDAERDPPRQISDRDLDHIRALYRGEIGWTDEAIGILLDELEESGRLENTLIVVTADHGEEFFEHAGRGHRQTLYDEVLRVPLLVVPPGGRKPGEPATRSELVSLSDLLPTILDYAGVPVPAVVHGRSLRPLIEGGERESRPVLTSLVTPVEGSPRGPGLSLLEGMRTPEYKILRRWLQFAGDEAPQFHSVEYFDLALDPREERPLTTLDDRRVRLAWRALEEELDAARRAWDGRARTPLAELSTDVARVMRSDLADLGYAGGGASSGEGGGGARLGVGPPPPAHFAPREGKR